MTIEEALGPRLTLPAAPTLAALHESESGARFLAAGGPAEDVERVVALLIALDGHARAVDALARRLRTLRPDQFAARWLRQDLLGLDLEPAWRALSDPDAAARCAVCEPGFGIEIAESLLGSGALARLDALAAQGWLAAGDGFRMPGPLRARAARHLSDEAWGLAKRDHVHHFVERMRRTRPTERAGAPVTLLPAGDHANLRAAIDHAVAIGATDDVAALAARLANRDARDRADLDCLNGAIHALRAAGAPARAQVELRLVRGRLLHRSGSAGGVDDAEWALTEAERAGLDDLATVALGALVTHHAGAGRLDAAEALLPRIRDTWNARLVPRAYLVVGTGRLDAGEPERAAPLLRRALESARVAGARDLEAGALLALGSIEADRRGDEAPARLSEAASLFRAVGQRSGAALARLLADLVALDRGAPAAEVAARLAAVEAPREEVARLRAGFVGLAWMSAGEASAAASALEEASGALMPDHRHYAPVFRAGLRAARAKLGVPDDAPLDGDPRGLADVARTFEALASLAAARRALGTGRALVDLPALASAVAPPRGLEARLARRAWDEAWRDLHGALGPALVVHPAGDWFRPPHGETVDLRARPTLARMLAVLVDGRRAGRAYEPGALFREAWPGERVLPKAALNRLRVALVALRDSGLRSWLLTRDGAYLLDPDVPLVIGAEV